MNSNDMLTMISVLMGFFGAILMAKGIIKLTPDLIAKQAGTYLGYNQDQIESIAFQKADVFCGILLIYVAFILQIISLISLNNSIQVFKSYNKDILASLSVSLIFAGLFYILNMAMKKKNLNEVNKVIAKDRLNGYLRHKKLSKNNYKDISNEAEIFFAMKKNEEESNEDFLKRYCKYLEVEIPKEIDLSELKE